MGRGWREKTPSRNIAEMLNLDTCDPKEQAIANALIRRFDRDHFRKLLLEWVVDANIFFRQPEHSRLRAGANRPTGTRGCNISQVTWALCKRVPPT